jgi:hypothetical protein
MHTRESRVALALLGFLLPAFLASLPVKAQVVPIADIQADPAAYEGQEVTVEGIVYIPADYRGSTISGYIQDDSNRGINLFGNGFDVAATQTVGNLVRVTGTVDLYFTTVEILDPTEVTLVSSGLARPDPVVLGTGQAANSQWEGTFIEVTAPIVSQSAAGPGINYTVDDGSGPVVIRVVDTLGAPGFANGETITGRGAGSQFGTDFEVLVGTVSDVFTGPAEFSVIDAASVDATTVEVIFNHEVDLVTGGTSGNYQVYESASPSNVISVSLANVMATAVTLTLGESLLPSVEYTVEVTGVQDAVGGMIGTNNTATFTYVATNVIPIADIQDDPSSYEGQTVTVEGIVYIPTDYRGTVISGFIQDESNRGINLFGTGFDVPATQTIGNRVRVTATVELYFTTVELTDPSELIVLATGQPRPEPPHLSTGQAADPQWEGTFIQVSGTVESQSVAGPGVNYTVDDGSGPIVVRVVDTLGAPSFPNGESIVARGAGGQFSTDFQVLVGVDTDVFVKKVSADTSSWGRIKSLF